MVFTVSIARPRGEGLELIQLFMPEPGAEAAFLHALEDELRRSRCLGTYNGATFDLPLLRARWIMARMPGELSRPPHHDLLHLTRALLRPRLQRCQLRWVEERYLNFERADDIPSSLVAQSYFTYLRRGWSPSLEAALRHNRQDVISLHHLHQKLLLRLDGLEPLMESTDWFALGRHLWRKGRRADGWRALRMAAEMRDSDASASAGLELARVLARSGSPAGAEAVLRGLEQALPADPRLPIARARLLELRLGDLPTALRVVEHAGARIPGAALDLERRRRRLLRRLPSSRPVTTQPAHQMQLPGLSTLVEEI